MAIDQCQHGMAAAGCSYCRGVASSGSAPMVVNSGVRSRQRLLDELCDQLGIARHAETPGSSPSRVFAAAANSAKVPSHSMPRIGAAIAAKAGLDWGPSCDNRSHRTEATRVTSEGIATVRQALAILAERRHLRSTKKMP